MVNWAAGLLLMVAIGIVIFALWHDRPHDKRRRRPF